MQTIPLPSQFVFGMGQNIKEWLRELYVFIKLPLGTEDRAGSDKPRSQESHSQGHEGDKHRTTGQVHVQGLRLYPRGKELEEGHLKRYKSLQRWEVNKSYEGTPGPLRGVLSRRWGFLGDSRGLGSWVDGRVSSHTCVEHSDTIMGYS